MNDASLSLADRTELQRLLAAADFGSGDSQSPAARDARQYRLACDGSDGQKVVSFDDLDPNPARHQLVAFVDAHATPA